MAIWFKNSNHQDVRNGVAYYQQGFDATLAIHFKERHLGAAQQIAPAQASRPGDLLVIFQVVGGAYRVVTHVLECLGQPVGIQQANNGFVYDMPTRVLARLQAARFAPNDFRNNGELLAEHAPPGAATIGDVVTNIDTGAAPGQAWSVAGGSPYKIYGGPAIGRCRVDPTLLVQAVLIPGHFDVVQGFEDLVHAAAE
jgi:hypothetical protein